MKLAKTMMLCLCALLLTNSLVYAKEKKLVYRESVLENITVIMENGSIYNMSPIDRTKWDLFIRKTPQIDQISTILVSTKSGTPRLVCISIKISGEESNRRIMSEFTKNSEIIDKTIVAIKEVLGVPLQG